jgi:hypothetical protein
LDAVRDTAKKSDFEVVARMRIVFAHQSVGENLLDGVERLATELGTELPIVESQTIAEAGVGISHFFVGENGNPEGKLSDFSARLSGVDAASVDVALLKFCYVDFGADTDAHALARRYIDSLEALQAANANTTFVAITAPLTTVQAGPKAWVKRLLGRSPYGLLENVKREQFNDELRRHFESPRLFDLARIEAPPEASVRALDPRLSSDGGHLNAEGRVVVGAAFVKLLADIGRSRDETIRDRRAH